jgi:glycoside/pentoside/hexuronide:cation symporter, GPH family
MEERNIKALGASSSTMFNYAFGALGVGIKNNLLGVWLLIYYNQVLGLDAILVSSAMALALIVDAVSDPFVGIWSDRLRSKWGRRHPFMYLAIIPFTLSFYFILQDPRPLSDQDLFMRLVFLMIVMRLAMTFYEVPRGALAPELTKDYDQRNTISAWGMCLGWVGGAGISFIHQYYFLQDSYLFAGGYQLLAFWGGLGIFLSTTYTTISTHRHIPDLHKPPERNFNLTIFLREARQTLSNKSWLVLFFAGCIYAMLVGVDTGALTYYNQFFWEWQPQQVAIWSLTSAIAVIFFAVFAPLIAKGRSKKNIAVGVFLTTIIVGPLPVFLRLIDPYFDVQLFPLNGSDLLWWILAIHAALVSSLGALGFIFIGSMAMEIVEDVERDTGRREEGLLGTVNSFVQKLVGAGGVLIAGIIVSASGFDDPNVTVETAANNFALTHLIIGFILPIFSTLLILLFNIDRNDHLDNVTDLGYVEKG